MCKYTSIYTCICVLLLLLYKSSNFKKNTHSFPCFTEHSMILPICFILFIHSNDFNCETFAFLSNKLANQSFNICSASMRVQCSTLMSELFHEYRINQAQDSKDIEMILSCVQNMLNLRQIQFKS